jgi:hypothetical protein
MVAMSMRHQDGGRRRQSLIKSGPTHRIDIDHGIAKPEYKAGMLDGVDDDIAVGRGNLIAIQSCLFLCPDRHECGAQ